MKDDGKIDGPVFVTFDTASVKYKQTKLEIQVKDLQNILEYASRSSKPIMMGQIAMWLELRMNYVESCIENLTDSGKLIALSAEDLKHYGFGEHAEAYWLPEKLPKRI